MAIITRGHQDPLVQRVKGALDDYERLHPGATARLYRHNSASVRVRIIDDRFQGRSKGERHDDVWRFMKGSLDEDDIQEIAMLLLLTPDEQGTSFLNGEFNDPIPSTL